MAMLLPSATQQSAQDEGLVSMFRVSGVLCAVPLAATVEVIPRPPRLAPAPFAAGIVAGTVQLRGNIIPVLDLASTFNHRTDQDEARIILVISEQDRLLGILVDELCGLRKAGIEQLIPLQFKTPAGGRPLFTGTFQSENDNAYLLDADAVCSLAGVPTVARQRESGVNANRQERKPILFFRAGSLMLAINAVDIEATVPACTVTEGPLTSGFCLGTIVHLDHVLPVADLGMVLGFERTTQRNKKTAALVICFPNGGRVALAVDDVHDIGSGGGVTAGAIPSVGPLGKNMMSGIVSDKDDAQHMLLRTDRLMDNEALLTLSRISHPVAKSSSRSTVTGIDKKRDAAQAETTDFLFFKSGRNFATHLKQISQIIPFPREAICFPDAPDGLLGVVSHRSKSVLLIDLGVSLGTGEAAERGQCYVLLVDAGENAYGLVVEYLYTVEKSHIQSTGGEAVHGAHRNPHLPPSHMVSMRQNGSQQLVEYIDLVSIVERLVSEQQPASQTHQLALAG